MTRLALLCDEKTIPELKLTLTNTHCGCLLGLLFLILLCCTKLLVFGVTWQCNFILCNLLKHWSVVCAVWERYLAKNIWKHFFFFYSLARVFVWYTMCTGCLSLLIFCTRKLTWLAYFHIGQTASCCCFLLNEFRCLKWIVTTIWVSDGSAT